MTDTPRRFQVVEVFCVRCSIHLPFSSGRECRDGSGPYCAPCIKELGHPLTPYDELEIESNAVGWPVSFKTDMIEHDKPRLQGDDAPEVFGWVLRELGTLLLDPRMSKTSLEGYVRHLADADGKAHCYYWYNGRKLENVGHERMIRLLREHNEPSGVEKHSIY